MLGLDDNYSVIKYLDWIVKLSMINCLDCIVKLLNDKLFELYSKVTQIIKGLDWIVKLFNDNGFGLDSKLLKDKVLGLENSYSIIKCWTGK